MIDNESEWIARFMFLLMLIAGCLLVAYAPIILKIAGGILVLIGFLGVFADDIGKR